MDVARLVKMHDAGMNYAEIAKAVGEKYWRVSRAIREAGHGPGQGRRANPIAPKHVLKWHKQRLRGKTQREIAEQSGVSHQYVSSALSRYAGRLGE